MLPGGLVLLLYAPGRVPPGLRLGGVRGVLATMIAIGFHRAWPTRSSASKGRDAVERREAMLKSMRLHGLDEDALRQFVCKYSGEPLGGVLRDASVTRPNGRPRSLGPRRARSTPPAVRSLARPDRPLDHAKQQASEARERRLLQKIEEQWLEVEASTS